VYSSSILGSCGPPNRAMLRYIARYLLLSLVHPSICPSDIGLSRCLRKRLNVYYRITVTQTTPCDSPGTLVLWCKRFFLNSDGIIPDGGAKCRWGIGKNCVFYRSKSIWLRHLTAENFCPSATVIGVHDGALAEEYAVSSTTLVVVEVCW